MKPSALLQFLGATACMALASCELTPYSKSDPASRRGSGYSLDNPPSGQSRYLPGTPARTTPPPSTVNNPPESSDDPTPTTPPVQDPPPVVSGNTPPVPPTPPAPPAASGGPGYASPVPGRKGFVYPPGVEAKEENMVDVRDFPPGSKVRHPTKGYIFLVP